MRKKNSSPRVSPIQPDGGVTLAGLNAQDLRSILCAATIHTQDRLSHLKCDPDPLNPVFQSSLSFHDGMRKLLEAASAALAVRVAETFPAPAPPTKAQRLAAVQDARKERLLIDSLLNNALRERRQ